MNKLVEHFRNNSIFYIITIAIVSLFILIAVVENELGGNTVVEDITEFVLDIRDEVKETIEKHESED